VIHFHLLCDRSHEFDGWFRSGEDFDRQCASALVSCPFCGSTNVRKALMSPAIASTRKTSPAQSSENAPSVSLELSERERALFQAWRQITKKIRQNADYVGGNFAEEARKIHFGESQSRAIYGEARTEEVSNLLDEGIEVIPLPVLPEEQN